MVLGKRGPDAWITDMADNCKGRRLINDAVIEDGEGITWSARAAYRPGAVCSHDLDRPPFVFHSQCLPSSLADEQGYRSAPAPAFHCSQGQFEDGYTEQFVIVSVIAGPSPAVRFHQFRAIDVTLLSEP